MTHNALIVPFGPQTGVVFDAAGAWVGRPGPDGFPINERPATDEEAGLAAALYWGLANMPVTQEQINAAADSLAVQKLQTTLQREDSIALAEYRAAESAKAEAYRAAQLALQQKQAAAAEALLALNRDAAGELATREQEAFAELFRLCLEARRVPLGTATTDAAMADIMRDAMYMATFAWPTYKAQLDALAAETPAAKPL
jgi:hypothetical protein